MQENKKITSGQFRMAASSHSTRKMRDAPDLGDETILKVATNSEIVSYCLGYQAGKNLQTRFGELEINLLLHGFSDAVKDMAPMLGHQEIAAILERLSLHVQEHEKKLASANKEREENFFRDHSQKPGVYLLKNGVQYKIQKSGSGGQPSQTDSVLIHYRCSRLKDATVIASTYEKNNPTQREVSNFIPGLSSTLTQMKVGDKWKIYIPSRLAYGEQGHPPIFEPNESLIYEVELLKIIPQLLT